jgi:putative ABC transport system permease protein
MKGFSMIALFIGALGLFSLASFSTQRKGKEIGIRKVMGASRGQIIFILLYEFQKISAIGILIATPIAYFLIDSWLSNFAYKVEINLLNFLAASLITIFVVALSVIQRTWIAASIDPVKILKNE